MASVQRQLVHKQFNSPIGLYSDQNVKETLDRELKAFSNGAPGIGYNDSTKPVNLENSAVLKMLQEEENEYKVSCDRKSRPRHRTIIDRETVLKINRQSPHNSPRARSRRDFSWPPEPDSYANRYRSESTNSANIILAQNYNNKNKNNNNNNTDIYDENMKKNKKYTEKRNEFSHLKEMFDQGTIYDKKNNNNNKKREKKNENMKKNFSVEEEEKENFKKAKPTTTSNNKKKKYFLKETEAAADAANTISSRSTVNQEPSSSCISKDTTGKDEEEFSSMVTDIMKSRKKSPGANSLNEKNIQHLYGREKVKCQHEWPPKMYFNKSDPTVNKTYYYAADTNAKNEKQHIGRMESIRKYYDSSPESTKSIDDEGSSEMLYKVENFQKNYHTKMMTMADERKQALKRWNSYEGIVNTVPRKFSPSTSPSFGGHRDQLQDFHKNITSPTLERFKSHSYNELPPLKPRRAGSAGGIPKKKVTLNSYVDRNMKTASNDDDDDIENVKIENVENVICGCGLCQVCGHNLIRSVNNIKPPEDYNLGNETILNKNIFEKCNKYKKHHYENESFADKTNCITNNRTNMNESISLQKQFLEKDKNYDNFDAKITFKNSCENNQFSGRKINENINNNNKLNKVDKVNIGNRYNSEDSIKQNYITPDFDDKIKRNNPTSNQCDNKINITPEILIGPCHTKLDNSVTEKKLSNYFIRPETTTSNLNTIFKGQNQPCITTSHDQHHDHDTFHIHRDGKTYSNENINKVKQERRTSLQNEKEKKLKHEQGNTMSSSVKDNVVRPRYDDVDDDKEKNMKINIYKQQSEKVDDVKQQTTTGITTPTTGITTTTTTTTTNESSISEKYGDAQDQTCGKIYRNPLASSCKKFEQDKKQLRRHGKYYTDGEYLWGPYDDNNSVIISEFHPKLESPEIMTNIKHFHTNESSIVEDLRRIDEYIEKAEKAVEEAEIYLANNPINDNNNITLDIPLQAAIKYIFEKSRYSVSPKPIISEPFEEFAEIIEYLPIVEYTLNDLNNFSKTLNKSSNLYRNNQHQMYFDLNNDSARIEEIIDEPQLIQKQQQQQQPLQQLPQLSFQSPTSSSSSASDLDLVRRSQTTPLLTTISNSQSSSSPSSLSYTIINESENSSRTVSGTYSGSTTTTTTPIDKIIQSKNILSGYLITKQYQDELIQNLQTFSDVDVDVDSVVVGFDAIDVVHAPPKQQQQSFHHHHHHHPASEYISSPIALSDMISAYQADESSINSIGIITSPSSSPIPQPPIPPPRNSSNLTIQEIQKSPVIVDLVNGKTFQAFSDVVGDVSAGGTLAAAVMPAATIMDKGGNDPFDDIQQPKSKIEIIETTTHDICTNFINNSTDNDRITKNQTGLVTNNNNNDDNKNNNEKQQSCSGVNVVVSGLRNDNEKIGKTKSKSNTFGKFGIENINRKFVSHFPDNFHNDDVIKITNDKDDKLIKKINIMNRTDVIIPMPPPLVNIMKSTRKHNKIAKSQQKIVSAEKDCNNDNVVQNQKFNNDNDDRMMSLHDNSNPMSATRLGKKNQQHQHHQNFNKDEKQKLPTLLPSSSSVPTSPAPPPSPPTPSTPLQGTLTQNEIQKSSSHRYPHRSDKIQNCSNVKGNESGMVDAINKSTTGESSRLGSAVVEVDDDDDGDDETKNNKNQNNNNNNNNSCCRHGREMMQKQQCNRLFIERSSTAAVSNYTPGECNYADILYDGNEQELHPNKDHHQPYFNINTPNPNRIINLENENAIKMIGDDDNEPGIRLGPGRIYCHHDGRSYNRYHPSNGNTKRIRSFSQPPPTTRTPPPSGTTTTTTTTTTTSTESTPTTTRTTTENTTITQRNTQMTGLASKYSDSVMYVDRKDEHGYGIILPRQHSFDSSESRYYASPSLYMTGHFQPSKGYKRVAWPPTSEVPLIRASTPVPVHPFQAPEQQQQQQYPNQNQQPSNQAGQHHYQSQPTQSHYPQQSPQSQTQHQPQYQPQQQQQQVPQPHFQQQHQRQPSPSFPSHQAPPSHLGQQGGGFPRGPSPSTVSFSGGIAQNQPPVNPPQAHYSPQPHNQAPQFNNPTPTVPAPSPVPVQSHQQYQPDQQQQRRGWSHVTSPTPTRTGYAQTFNFSPNAAQSQGSNQNQYQPQSTQAFQPPSVGHHHQQPLPPTHQSYFPPPQDQSYQQQQFAPKVEQHQQQQQPQYNQAPQQFNQQQFNQPQQQFNQPQQQYYSQAQHQPNQYPGADRGQSPGIITLRKEVPTSQRPAPVITSQPAAVTFGGGSNMRGDLKWPPPEYKAQAVVENAERIKVAQGPACRPRRVNKVGAYADDYSQFFAQHALNSTYPGYRAPPGTQHMYVQY